MKRVIFGLVAVAVLLIGGATYGQTPTKAVPQNEEAGKPWSFTGGFDIQSKYIFRGFATTKEGFIGQPYGQLAYKAYDDGNLSISPYIGTWVNLTSEPYAIKNGQTSNPDWLSETDVDAGVTLEFKNFTVGVNYIYYLYPNGSIAEDQEVGITVGYDDSELWKEKALGGLHPHVAYYHETQNRGGVEGGYIELGAEPTLKAVNIGKVPVTLSVPLNVGLTHDDYYTDEHGNSETFGYFEVGVKASLPLTFLNKGGGEWNLVGEVDYWHLNADNLRSLDGGRSDDVTARIGIAFSY